MPAIALSRLKSLSDGGSFMIDVKYEASRPVMSNTLFIQNTNTDIAIYENSQALQSRMVKLNWTNRNFRQEKDDIDFDLKELLGNPALGIPANEEFIEAFLSVAIFETPYFKQFTIPKEVQADTNELLNENDQVKGYIDFLELQGVTQLPYLNIKTEHARYTNWLADTNSSAKPLKIKNFSKEFSRHINELGFKECEDLYRPVSFSNLDYNNEVINNITGYEINEYSKRKTVSKYWFNPSNLINKNSVNVNNELDINSAVDVQKYYYLAYEQNEVSIIDKYQSLIED